MKIVFINEFIRNLKNKKKFLFNLILPIVAVIFAVTINYIIKPSIKIGVISNSEISRAFIEDCNKIEGVKALYDSNKTYNSDIILGKYDVIIDIKNDNEVKVISRDKKSKQYIKEIMEEYINCGDVNLFKEFLEASSKEQLSLEDRTICFMFIIICVMATLFCNNIVKDSKNGIIKRISISNYSIKKYLLGTFLFYFSYILVQCIVTTFIIKILPININMSFSKLILISLLMSIISSSIGYILVIICNNEIASSMIASSVTVILSLLGGAFLPISKMPDMLVKLSDLSTVKWLMNINDLRSVIAIIILSIILIIIATIIGNRRFRTI